MEDEYKAVFTVQKIVYRSRMIPLHIHRAAYKDKSDQPMEQPVSDQITDPNRQGISNAICRKEKQKELRRRGAGIRAVLCIGYTNPIIAALLSNNHLVLQYVHSTLYTTFT